jgi:hypothetical protein
VPVSGTRHEIHSRLSHIPLFRQEAVKVHLLFCQEQVKARRLAAKLMIENSILPILVQCALSNEPEPNAHAQ